MARVKSHTKVHVSVAYHEKTRDAWANLAHRGMLVELWRLAMERYAGKRNDIIGLTQPDRMSISCQVSSETADRMLESLLLSVGYSVRKYPNRWDVSVRKYALKNGFDTPELNDVVGTSKYKNPTPKKKKKKKKKIEEKTGATAPSLPASGGKIPKPESFGSEQYSPIHEWATRKGYSRATLTAGMEIFREWEPLKHPRRTEKQWASAFKRICSGSVEDGKIGAPKRQSAEEWKGYGPDEDPQAIGKLIEQSLRQNGGGP